MRYFVFISSLFHLSIKENNVSLFDKILHIGESHCLSFAHQNISIDSKPKTIQPLLVTGGKAWHFANKDFNRWKSSLCEQLRKHKCSKEVFISFGEIDCRKDEGILPYSIKHGKDIYECCLITIEGYLNFMESKLSTLFEKR